MTIRKLLTFCSYVYTGFMFCISLPGDTLVHELKPFLGFPQGTKHNMDF